MAQYYFVVTSLPPLVFGKPVEISFKELLSSLQMNLTFADLKKIRFLLQPIDLYNIKAFWLGFPLDDKGTLLGKALEEALLMRDVLPQYLIDFLERYESLEERLRYFSSLYTSLYSQEWEGFLGKYYRFEREVRLVMTALRCKKADRDVVRELQFEDSQDPIVAHILAQKDTPDYTPPIEYEDLKALFVENGSEPNKMASILLKYRFDKIEEMGSVEHFTVDRILSYVAQLLIVEGWQYLDREKGNMAVKELIEYE